MGRLRAARTERWGNLAALLVASMYVIWCHSLGFSFVYIVKLSLYFFFGSSRRFWQAQWLRLAQLEFPLNE